jgi:signal transduction histidine kinase
VKRADSTDGDAAILEGLSRALAWLVLVLACSVVAGWAFDVRALTTVLQGYNSMKFNTALCLLGLSIALLACTPLARWAAMAGVGLLTFATLVEMATGTSLGIDELIFSDTATTGAAPGRMAPATATGLLALTVALMLVRSGRTRTAQVLLLLPMTIGLTAILGYAFDVEQLYQVASLTSVALHTAVAMLLTTVAIAGLIPRGILAWTVRGPGPGAKIMRQTTPIITIGLTALGQIRMRLGDAGAFGEHFGIALMVLVGILISAGVTTFAAARLDEREKLLVQEHGSVLRLSELNRMRDEFIAVAGHELRSPVTVILGYCELLTDPAATDADRREGAAVIARRAEQLNELVGQLFDLAKMDAGLMDLDIEPVPVATFVADLIAGYRHSALAAGVDLSMDAVDAVVLADRTRLQQVFDGLLSNALKYTPAGGHVVLKVTLNGGAVVFELADDGIGVEPEELPHLCERLFRASSARDAQIPGTGLGLAVAKSLVEAQGGTLIARQNQPRGLVFCVTLPEAVNRQG